MTGTVKRFVPSLGHGWIKPHIRSATCNNRVFFRTTDILNTVYPVKWLPYEVAVRFDVCERDGGRQQACNVQIVTSYARPVMVRATRQVFATKGGLK